MIMMNFKTDTAISSKITKLSFGKVCVAYFFLLPLPYFGVNNTLTVATIFGVILCVFLALKKRYYCDRYMMMVFLLFIIGELLSLLICTNTSKSVSYTLQKAIVLFVVYSLTMSYVAGDSNRLDRCINSYKIGCLITALLSMAYYVFGVSVPFISTKFATGRLVVSGLGPNVVARLICVGAFICLYYAQIKKKKEKVLSYIEYGICSLTILSTISTSGMALLAIGSILIVLKYNEGVKKLGAVKIIAMIIGIIILAIIAYYTIPFVQNQVDKLLLRSNVNQMIDAGQGEYTFHGRLNGLENIWKYLQEFFIVGVGYGCSSVLSGTTIHFPIIASYIETGIFGFVSCLIMYGVPVVCALKIFKSKQLGIYGIISMVIFMGDMIQPNPNYVFTWFAIFLCCAAHRCQKNNTVL